jgi:hypothetical protein
LSFALLSGLERCVCACFGTVAYSSLPSVEHGLDDVALAEARRDARYFAMSNGIRAGLLLLMAVLLRSGPWFALVPAAAGSLFHGVLTVVECYRYSVVLGFEFQHADPKPSAPSAPPSLHPYFGPHPWEPLTIYRLLGSEVARRFILSYKAWARDESSTKLGPAPTVQVSRSAAYETIRQSRQAEVIHLAGAAFDGVILAGVLRLPGFWWVLPVLGIVLDLELVLLQRSHRIRLRRLHRRVPALAPKSEMNTESI